MFRLYLFIGLLIGQFAFLQAQTISFKTDDASNTIQSLNLASETLIYKSYEGDLLAILDQTFDDLRAQSDISGFNAAIILPDGTVWKRAKGQAIAMPFPQPLEEDHLMGMGSISKSFVSTTIMLLLEEGLINLEDPLNMYLTDYPNIDGNITVQQILSHTGGINDFLNENPATTAAWSTDFNHIWTIDEVLNNYVLEPNFQPGTSYSYSNTGFLLAGKLIEVITSKNWYEVVREKIIDPLGLESTFVYPWESHGIKLFAHAYVDLDGNGTVEDAQASGIDLDGLFSLASSAGCLISTPEDIARFNKSLFTGDIVNPASLAAMQTDYTMNIGGLTYGLGVASFPVGLDNWGHNGSLIYNSFGLYFPTENISIAIQQNDARLNGNGVQIVDIYTVFLGLLEAYLNYDPVSTADVGMDKSQVAIYPNPANNVVNIDANPSVDHLSSLPLKIFDSRGHEKLNTNLRNHRMTITLDHLPSGLYFLQIGDKVHKLVVE